MIDIELIKSKVSYDPATGVFTRLVSSTRKDKIGKPAGTIATNGYVYINIGKKLYSAHRLALALTYGKEPSGHVDHINRNRADNRLVNLRECPTKQKGNAQNSSLRSDNTSGFVGVHWFPRTSSWQAYINADGKRKHLGYFKDLEAAKNAYALAKRKQHRFHGDVVYG